MSDDMFHETLRRRRIGVGVVAGLVVVALIVVAVLGGFRFRSSGTLPIPLGTEIDTGMMIFVPQSATVTFHTNMTEKPWEIVISLKVRNPKAEALRPLVASGNNILGVDPRTRLIASSPSDSLFWDAPEGDDFTYSGRSLVPPESDWMHLRLRVRHDNSFEPGDTYLVALRQMQFRATAHYGYSDAKSWAPNRFARIYTVEVPLTRLPDRD